MVGVSGLGGSTDFATRLALREAGLVPDKDVAIRGVGGVPETVAALKAKVVQAGTLSPPSSFVAQKAGFKILFDMSSLGVDYVSSGLGIKKASLAANRLEAKQFLMAMIEGAKILTRDEEFALRVLTKHTRISDREVLKQSYDYLRPYFLKVPYPSARAIKDTLDVARQGFTQGKRRRPERFHRQLGFERDRGERLYRGRLWKINPIDSFPLTITSICVGCRRIFGVNACRRGCASAARM